MIGVGRITCGNRELHSLRKPEGAFVIEFLDGSRKGAAHGRNQCLAAMMAEGCDYMFLFDDDCYPIMDGWAEYFIHWSAMMSIDYFGLPEAFKSKPMAINREVIYWSNIIGCFNFQTRAFMEKVGYYGSEFTGYGYEDSARNNRAMRSGLVGNNGGYFPSLLRAPSYIFSEDVYARNPTPNLTFDEKQEGIARNLQHCIASNNSSEIYVPFEP